MKRAAFLERKVLRMWVGGKERRGEGRRGEGGDRGEGEGEQSSVGALTGRGADRPRRGRVIEMCFYSGGGEEEEGGREKKKSCREEEKEEKKKKRELQKLNEQASPEK